MKDTFILRTSYLEQIGLLSLEQRGVLLTAVFNYAAGHELPDMDGMVQMAFAFIRADLDRDAEKYERVCEVRREAGKKGGRPKANAESGKQEKAKKANGFFDKQNNPDNDSDNDNDIKENTSKEVQKKRFKPPTLDEVKAYIAEKGYSVDAERFIDFYTSKGWVVGKSPMKDWKAAVRTWAKGQKQNYPSASVKKPSGRFDNFEQRTYDFNALEAQLLRAQMGG